MGSVSIPSETKQAIVYMRDVRWDVVVPLGLEWEFMRKFGEAFRLNDPMEGGHFIRPVDRYYEHGGGWHIKVSVNESEEVRLLKFCREFFGSHGIPFREPEAVVHTAALAFLGLFNKIASLKLKSGEVRKGRVSLVGPTWVSLDFFPDPHPEYGGAVNTDFDEIDNATLEE